MTRTLLFNRQVFCLILMLSAFLSAPQAGAMEMPNEEPGLGLLCADPAATTALDSPVSERVCVSAPSMAGCTMVCIVYAVFPTPRYQRTAQISPYGTAPHSAAPRLTQAPDPYPPKVFS